MLSPEDLARAVRGQEFKRLVRSAGALSDLYEDVQIADAVGVTRNAVQGWWRGAQPSVPTLRRLSEAVGVPFEELLAAAHPEEGAAPSPGPKSPGLDDAVRESLELDARFPRAGSASSAPPAGRRRPG